MGERKGGLPVPMGGLPVPYHYAKPFSVWIAICMDGSGDGEFSSSDFFFFFFF